MKGCSKPGHVVFNANMKLRAFFFPVLETGARHHSPSFSTLASHPFSHPVQIAQQLLHELQMKWQDLEIVNQKKKISSVHSKIKKLFQAMSKGMYSQTL